MLSFLIVSPAHGYLQRIRVVKDSFAGRKVQFLRMQIQKNTS
jgi:hypothetical protein